MVSDLDVQSLPGTEPLTWEDDIASRLVAGVDTFLLGKLAEALERRPRHWARDLSSAEDYARSVEPNRQRLAHILGVRDQRVPFAGVELVGFHPPRQLVTGVGKVPVRQPHWPMPHATPLSRNGRSGAQLDDIAYAYRPCRQVDGLTRRAARPSQQAGPPRPSP